MTVGSVILFVLAIGASLLSQAIAERKAKKKPLDDTPAILAERGAWIPRVSGKRRLGHIVGKVWGRGSRREKVGKKKPFSARPKIRVYTEHAVHWLCVGPAVELTEIESGGKVIYSATITNVSHPSGTLINLGAEGAFIIYWGEETQPLNANLAAADAMSINSRWNGVCYIEWFHRRLGTTPRWPAHNYVIKTELQETHLVRTDPHLPEFTAGVLDSGGSHRIYQAFNGAEGVGYFLLDGAFSRNYSTGAETFRLQGAPWTADEDLEAFQIDVGVPIGLYGGGLVKRWDKYFPVGGVSGVNEAVYNDFTLADHFRNHATMRPYLQTSEGGPNPGHYMAEILFSRAPHGLERPKALFDLESFEVLAELMVAEDIHGSFIAQDGLDMQALLGLVMQDLGVLMPINPTNGKIQVLAVRPPTTTPKTLTADLQTDLPETEINHGPRKVDKLVFNFVDADNRYRTTTLGFDDDGQVTRLKYAQAREIQIVSTVHHETAVKIVDRRSSEELSGAGVIVLHAMRGARVLLPGEAIFADGFTQRLRVLSVEPLADTDTVRIEVSTDFYAKPAGTYVPPGGHTDNETAGDEFIEADLEFRIFEIPEAMNVGEPPNVMCLRQRASDTFTFVHVSDDGVTYLEDPDYDDSIHTGGFLLEAIPADGLYVPAVGPTFQETAFPADLAEVLDLTSDLPSWRRGKQLVAIGDELFYLKGITDMTGGAWRLDGLIRARKDTRREAHAVGAPIYIFQNDDGAGIEVNPPVTPETTLFMKSQPVGIGDTTVELSTIEERTLTLYGKGSRPVPVSDIRLDFTSHTFRHGMTSSGNDLNFLWDYSTPRTQSSGAGEYQAGDVRIPIEPEGGFLLEIKSTGDDILYRTAVTATASFVYTAAMRSADVTQNLNLLIKITQQRGGFVSGVATQVFERIG